MASYGATPIRGKRIEKKMKKMDRQQPRQRARSPYSAMEYFDDMGIATTKAEHEKYLKKEQEYAEAKKKAMGLLSQQDADITKHRSSLDDWKKRTEGGSATIFKQAWEKYRDTDKDVETVKIKNAKGETLGSYRVHNTTTGAYNKHYADLDISNQGKLQLAQGTAGKELLLDPRAKEMAGDDVSKVVTSKSYYNKKGELIQVHLSGNIDNHKKVFSDYEEALETAYTKKVKPEVEAAYIKSLKEYNKSQGALSQAQAGAAVNKATVAQKVGMKEQRDMDVRESYKLRVKNMEALFGGLKVDKRAKKA